MELDDSSALKYTKRLRLFSVREGGLQESSSTRNLMQGRMLELPLKPLSHIVFVRVYLPSFLSPCQSGITKLSSEITLVSCFRVMKYSPPG